MLRLMRHAVLQRQPFTARTAGAATSTAGLSLSRTEAAAPRLPLYPPPARRCPLSHRLTTTTNTNTDGATTTRAALRPPNGSDRVLLHSCCAPCSGAMIEEMHEQGLDVTIYFYNPNIHPRLEYTLRKNENKRFAEELGINFVDADYDADEFFRRAKGMEFDPERGPRCTMCFDMRLDKTAQYAATHGFPTFTTTNATSRWKDQDQVNSSGMRAGRMWGVEYWLYDWQTDRMTERKYQINADRSFYKQQYCGCSYSMRDSNAWREENGMEPIKIGTTFYEDPIADAAEEAREVVEGFFAEFDYRNQLRKEKRARRRVKTVDNKEEKST